MKYLKIVQYLCKCTVAVYSLQISGHGFINREYKFMYDFSVTRGVLHVCTRGKKGEKGVSIDSD